MRNVCKCPSGLSRKDLIVMNMAGGGHGFIEETVLKEACERLGDIYQSERFGDF